MIKDLISESIEVKKKILENDAIIALIQRAADTIYESLSENGKVLLCGNGGSASDSLHIAGELLGRFQRERKALPAIALNADVATLTAVANDYGYNKVFEREVEGLMSSNDTLIGISTSGNSENVFLAIKKAKEIGGKTIAFLGRDGGKIKEYADISIIIPSDCTARIQESHIMIGHIICELVENSYANGWKKSNIS